MKFVFVVGGSYKSFYLNNINKIKKVDLLVFNQNIFYDFDYEKEFFEDAPVTKELINLNKIFNCPIVVYGRSKLMDIYHNVFIVCVNGKVSVANCNNDIYLYIKGKLVLVSRKFYSHTRGFATIVMNNDRYCWSNIVKKSSGNYFICDKKGVTSIQKGQINRKFRKCCYFSLCFYKKNDTIH